MSNEKQTKKRKSADPRVGEILSKDGRFFMWKDSLYSNSCGYDPLEARTIAGGVIAPTKREVNA
jgi:hypothetical protein